MVGNPVSPELNYLAAGLSERGVLRAYVRPYAVKGRGWERWLMTHGGSLYAKTWGRRLLPDGLDPALVAETGLAWDVLAAVVRRGRPAWGGMAQACEARRGAAVDREMARLLRADDCAVVANYGAGLRSLRRAAALGLPSVLNYPIAVHSFSQRILEEEADLVPDFARTLSFVDLPRELRARMDEECRMADRILVGSSFARESFRETGLDLGKIRVVPYGVDTDLFRPPMGEPIVKSVFRVLFVGQLSQRKGLSYLLEGYRQFRKSDTELLLVGNACGDYRPLEPWADYFTHRPNVPRSFLPALYRGADVLVLPSLVEGMPLVVLEAMACGVPVIVTANGPSDVVQDGEAGIVVPIRDSNAIAVALERMYSDADLRQRMGTRAASVAAGFTWQTYAERACSVVEEAGL